MRVGEYAGLGDDTLAARAAERQQQANVAQRHAASLQREADALRKEQQRRKREAKAA